MLSRHQAIFEINSVAGLVIIIQLCLLQLNQTYSNIARLNALHFRILQVVPVHMTRVEVIQEHQ
jgi:hypothetical protein